MNLACQVCKKAPATVHLTDITPEGEMRERHLCDACAAKQGVGTKPQAHVPIHQILSGFVNEKTSIQQLAELRCPDCGMTFVEFRSGGLLGCPRDYDAFEKALAPLIERAHEGSSHHIGKIPARLATPRDTQTDLLKLRRELTRAVDDENYEEAAKLRDKIQLLESQAR